MEQTFQVRNVFNEKVVTRLAGNLRQVWSGFDARGFRRSVIPRLDPLTFSERCNLICDVLWEFLPKEYPRALEIILAALPPALPTCELTGYDGFIVLPQNEYVAKYGLAHYELSMQALCQMTKRFSAEGAIRAYILKYPGPTMSTLAGWAEDENCHVRRLVSEGTRPRLPWTTQLRPFIEDPRPVLRLLEKLKTDPVLMVRRSVANNLNDIAKDNPDLVVKTLKRWKGIPDEGTQWLIRHAARTLVRQGSPEALAILGYDSRVGISFSNLQLDPLLLELGGTLHFSFDLKSTSAREQDLLIDYVIHHVKANGKRKPKVFKLAKRRIRAGESIHIAKGHPFRRISTRSYYPGKHGLEIQINGSRYGWAEFELE